MPEKFTGFRGFFYLFLHKLFKMNAIRYYHKRDETREMKISILGDVQADKDEIKFPAAVSGEKGNLNLSSRI
ncbi:hypothetical protein [Chryseobacterium koreense]|uniref:hypothetical protein n=1 Tax=Chryseobacterium koreense TaxID=232216 RepID=UPI0026EFB5D7|nr:hypothetical protein [Chryseobacterium koreense]